MNGIGGNTARRPLEIPTRCRKCGETASVLDWDEYLCGTCFRDRSIQRYEPKTHPLLYPITRPTAPPRIAGRDGQAAGGERPR